MPLFFYKAQKPTGELYEGTREAADKFVLYKELKKTGDTVVTAREVVQKMSFDWRRLGALFSRIKTHEKIVFARNLGAMISAGLSLSRALSVMERQSKNQKLKEVLAALNEEVRAGTTLGEALRKFPAVFSTLFVSMVKAGEESGSLAQSLSVLAGQMEKMYALQKKIRGALLYPAIVVTLMVVIGALMLVYVVPTLTATFKELNVALPLSTQFVIFVSDFLKENFFTAIGILLGLLLACYAALKTGRGKRVFDNVILRVPIVGMLVREVNTARTARTLSSLLSAGVDIVIAIQITGDVVQNVYFKEVLKKAEGNIQKGTPMSTVFMEHEHLYPAFLGEMVSVGEETGKLSDMLLGVGVFYEEEVDQKTKDMSTIIEPFLMVIIGVVVGFFAIALISPTYSLMNNI